MQESLGDATTGVSPSEKASRLAEEVITAEDLQRDILEEATSSGTESGRTVCGDAVDAKEPLERSYGSVTLQGCSLDNVALMHGGGGHDLSSPRHSLVDVANVLFGRADASIVVGSSQSDVFLAPDEEYRDGVIREFQSVVGAPVESISDLEEAFHSGELDDPDETRDRFREAFPGLFEAVHTPHPTVGGGAVASAPLDLRTAVQRGFVGNRERARSLSDRVRSLGRPNLSFTFEDVQFNFAEIIASQFVDALVLAGMLYLLGGTPTQLARKEVSSDASG